MRCYTEDEGRPFGVALRGRLQTASCCVGLKTVVVSDEEKAS